MSVDDKIEQIEYELSRVKRNKATEHYIGFLKARLSRLTEGGSSSKKGPVYAVKKQGDATVILVGFPSVGKSTLLNALTNAESLTAAYEFTTLRPIPGMLEYRKAKIQIVDVPGIIEGASKGRGGGKQILSAVRNADLILILLDPGKDRLDIIEQELYDAGVRINQQAPNILVKKEVKGGLIIESTVSQELGIDTFREVLKGFGFVNAQVLLREKVSLERFIDALSKNRVYVPAITVFNKVDVLSKSKINKLKKNNTGVLFISAKDEEGLEELRQAIWDSLEFKRIYLRKPGKEPDFEEPLILRGRCTVERVIKELKKDYSSAKVWGSSVKHPGQVVSVFHKLNDEDIVTLS